MWGLARTMHEFTVWAPNAEKVAVKIGERTHPMRGPNERGWRSAVVEDAGPGTDYGFVLGDDEQAWPDPRSKWQPYGVHGDARVYNQTAVGWSEKGWQGHPTSR